MWACSRADPLQSFVLCTNAEALLCVAAAMVTMLAQPPALLEAAWLSAEHSVPYLLVQC